MKINLEETNEEIVKRLGLALKRYTYPDITYYAYNNRNNRNYSDLINNMYHRDNGPAMVHHYRDGSTKNEYYLYNKKFTEDEYIELFCLYEDMLTNRNLAIMNMKHKFGFIRLRAKEVLDGLL
jgi:hypothetical protein